MKKMNLILIITILAMGAVAEAAGQPARGNGNGNHDKNNRKEDYGNDKYWKERHDNDKHWKEYHYSHYYRKHYLPESFRSNRYYAYHPKYGHVLTRFPHNPLIFWSTARIPFYFDNGFFYKYHSGIGYVWVNDPYDLWFSELPYGAVRVRIAGHTYYRFGNAYFVAGLRGFRLAVVPDRYYDYRPAIEISARF